MKRYIKILTFLFLFFFLPTQQLFATSDSDFLIHFNGQDYTYEDFWKENYGEYGGYSKEVYDTAFVELQKILDEMKKINNSTNPEDKIKKFILHSRLAVLVEYFGCCGGSNYLLPISSDLRSVGYALSDDEIQNDNYVYFRRDPYPDDLIKIANTYPDTDYEKEALYLIATKAPLSIYFSDVNFDENDISLLKPLIWRLQASKTFIEKYPNDPRISEIKDNYKKLAEQYSNSNQNDYVDESTEHFYQYLLNDGNRCLSGKEEGCQIDNLPTFSATVRKEPLEDVLNDELGHVEIVNDGFSKQQIIVMASLGILLIAGIGYGIKRKKK